MPKEYPNFKNDTERLIKTGRVKDESEAEKMLSEQKRLLEEREAKREKINELRQKEAPSKKEVFAEQDRRLEIVKQIYERRQERIREHFKKILEAGTSPFHEEIKHESEKLSQIEKDFERERGLFEQFDAEERLAVLHQFAEAVKSEDPIVLKNAKRKIEDVFDEQEGTVSFPGRNRNLLYGVLRAWARGELMLSDATEVVTDESGEKHAVPLSLEKYSGITSDNGYLREDVTRKILEGGCMQGKRTKDGEWFCLDCPPSDTDYKKADLRDWIFGLRKASSW